MNNTGTKNVSRIDTPTMIAINAVLKSSKGFELNPMQYNYVLHGERMEYNERKCGCTTGIIIKQLFSLDYVRINELKQMLRIADFPFSMSRNEGIRYAMTFYRNEFIDYHNLFSDNAFLSSRLCKIIH